MIVRVRGLVAVRPGMRMSMRRSPAMPMKLATKRLVPEGMVVHCDQASFPSQGGFLLEALL